MMRGVARIPARMNFDWLDYEVEQESGVGRDAARQSIAERYEYRDWTALHAEIERRAVLTRCDVEEARRQIERDASWATRELRGWTDHCSAAPLNFMAMLRFDATRLGLAGEDFSGTAEMARLLLASGAPVDGNPRESETPLITAASYGDPDVAKVLIDAGADIDTLSSADAGGVACASALCHAAVFGMTDVVDAIAAAGARLRSLPEAAAVGDISAWPTADTPEDERVRALIMAADHQRLDVIDQLLATGVSVDAVDPQWFRQALRVAAGNGRPASVRHLLARGADPTLKDEDGHTALDFTGPDLAYMRNAAHDEVAAILGPLTPRA
jgi:ankyrin repeat protein